MKKACAGFCRGSFLSCARTLQSGEVFRHYLIPRQRHELPCVRVAFFAHEPAAEKVTEFEAVIIFGRVGTVCCATNFPSSAVSRRFGDEGCAIPKPAHEQGLDHARGGFL